MQDALCKNDPIVHTSTVFPALYRYVHNLESQKSNMARRIRHLEQVGWMETNCLKYRKQDKPATQNCVCILEASLHKLTISVATIIAIHDISRYIHNIAIQKQ